MIRHIWTVICSRSVIDKDSNNISLHNVIEQIRVGIADPISPEDGIALAPIPFEIVSFWERLPPDQPQRGRGRIVLQMPSSELGPDFPIEYELDLSVHQRLRTRGRVAGMPLSESGRHEFRIQQFDDADNDWRDVATVPLDLIFDATESPEAQ